MSILMAQNFRVGDKFTIRTGGLKKIYPREHFICEKVEADYIVCRDLNDPRGTNEGSMQFIFCDVPLRSYSGRGEIVMDADVKEMIDDAEAELVKVPIGSPIPYDIFNGVAVEAKTQGDDLWAA